MGSLPGDGIVHYYPNPAISNITFDLQKASDKGYTLEIYTFLGQRKGSTINIADRYTLNLTDFYPGIYVYKLKDRNGNVIETGKFQCSK